MANGMLNFTSNEEGGPWSDGVAEDGEGGSLNLAGIVIQVGLISDANGTALGVPIEWHSDLFSSSGFNGLTTYDGRFTDLGWAGFVIKSADGSEFQIDSFQWYDWGDNTGKSYNLTGYRNNQLVTSSSFTSNADFSPDPQYNHITVTLNSSFDWVDEIRITSATGGGWGSINNIEIADPSVPPTVTSIVRANGAGAGLVGSATSAEYTVTFSESVTGVDASDFTLSATGSASGSIASVTGSGTTYIVTVNQLAGDGTLRLDLNGSGTGIQNGESVTIASGYTAGQSFTLDHTAPTAPSTPDLSPTSDTGSSDTDDITGDTTPTFIGTAEAGATVTLYINGQAVGSDEAGTDGRWTITTTQLEGGSYDVTAKATDLAGNVSGASAPFSLTVITAAPETENTSFILSSDTGFSQSDIVTRTASQTLTGRLDAALATGEQVQVWINGAWQTATSASGSDTWSLAATLEEGTHEAQVRVVNAIGNAGPVGKYSYTLDTTAPTVEITSNVETLKAGETATITFTFSEDPGATFTWDGSAGDVTVSGGTLSALSGTGATRTATFTPGSDVNNGTASITINPGAFADTAGNLNPQATTPALTFDTLAPSAPSAPMLAAGSDTGTSNSDRLTANTRPTFTGSAESGATVTLYDSKGNVIGSGTAVDGTWSIVPNAALAEGKHTISARAVDAAGNESAAAVGQEIIIDTTAPTLSITSDVSALKADETAIVTFTFTEDPGATFTLADVTVSGGTLGALSGTGLERTAVFTPTSDINGASASITVAAGSYADAAGNNGGGGLTPALTFDTKAPAAPLSLALEAADDTGSSSSDHLTSATTLTITGTGENGATVTLFGDRDNNGVLDDGEELASGTVTSSGFAIEVALTGEGAHIIRAQQTDTVGNISAVSEALTLTLDTLVPVVAVTSSTLSNAALPVLQGTAEDGATITVSVGGATYTMAATGGIWSLDLATATPDSGVLVLNTSGSNAVSITATDAAGNVSDPATQNLLIDTAAPILAAATPADNATNVARSANLVLTFSETVFKGTGMIALHASNGDVVESFDVAISSRISLTGDELTIDPTNPLMGGAGYYLTVSAGALKDAAGNSFAGIADSTTFNFTTAVDAPTGPVVTPNEQGGHTITIAAPGQLTADLGTSGVDTVLYAGSGTVVLPDTIENLRLSGSADANATGNARMNVFQGNAGDNLFDGAAGKDAVVYDVPLADVSLTHNTDGSLTVSGAGIGTDTLLNVELLRFADQVVLVHPAQVAAPSLFEEAYYLARNPDVAAAVEAGTYASGLAHFIRYGAAEGRAPAPQSLTLDEAFYLAQNPDVAAAVTAGEYTSGLAHYLAWGEAEGRDPNALLDEAWYLGHNPDVAAAVAAGTLKSGYEHYELYGWSEGRDPSAWLDVSAYLAANGDVAAAGMDPLKHILSWGVHEGRTIPAGEWNLWA